MKTEEVLKKYFADDSKISFGVFGDGATNLTYKISIQDGYKNKSFILQKMAAVFDVEMIEDINVVTKHLISKNILTQEVVKTLDGELYVEDGVFWWRMLTFIPGKYFSSVNLFSQAESAGKFVGLFHSALLDLNYEFKYKLQNFHDTNFVMDKLKFVLAENHNTDKYNQLKELAFNILSSYENFSLNIVLPERIIHGDLKISNVIFNDDMVAIALVDLDTFMRSTIAVELGDALRSWCMPGGEDVEIVKFDKESYQRALDGYFSSATFLTAEEKKSIPYGVQLITLELAARFVIDAFEESYFRLDSLKYKTLFEQNQKKAENQFSFYKEFTASGII